MKRPSANRRSLRSTQALEPQPGSPVHIRQSRINDLPAIRTIACLQDTELLHYAAGEILKAVKDDNREDAGVGEGEMTRI